MDEELRRTIPHIIYLVGFVVTFLISVWFSRQSIEKHFLFSFLWPFTVLFSLFYLMETIEVGRTRKPKPKITDEEYSKLVEEHWESRLNDE